MIVVSRHASSSKTRSNTWPPSTGAPRRAVTLVVTLGFTVIALTGVSFVSLRPPFFNFVYSAVKIEGIARSTIAGLGTGLAPDWKRKSMNPTMIDRFRQDPDPDRAPGPLDEVSREDPLELAYKARVRAVLHGTGAARVRTAQALVRLERICLQRRLLHRLADIPDIDPSYSLG